jgi:hypothetical protein
MSETMDRTTIVAFVVTFFFVYGLLSFIGDWIWVA